MNSTRGAVDTSLPKSRRRCKAIAVLGHWRLWERCATEGAQLGSLVGVCTARMHTPAISWPWLPPASSDPDEAVTKAAPCKSRADSRGAARRPRKDRKAADMTAKNSAVLKMIQCNQSTGQWMAEVVGPPRRYRHYVANLSSLAYNLNSGDCYPVGYHAVCGAIAMQADAAHMDRLLECPRCAFFVADTQCWSAA